MTRVLDVNFTRFVLCSFRHDPRFPFLFFSFLVPPFPLPSKYERVVFLIHSRRIFSETRTTPDRIVIVVVLFEQQIKDGAGMARWEIIRYLGGEEVGVTGVCTEITETVEVDLVHSRR